ncbi:MAG: pro-sigmaK processing inhibitor BofA family protein [Halobacteriota archaeon]
MAVTPAIGLLIVAILGLILLYALVKIGVRFGKHLAINSIVGIIVLIIANFFLVPYGLVVPINVVTILVCALAGIPGALLVILLVVLGIPV